MHTQDKKTPYERDILIVKSNVLKHLKKKGFRVNNLTPRAVNDAVLELLDKAMTRTKLSKRKTVAPRDI